ncbi:hypothetical protein K2173_010482 [Erythroxylum novogranatense]|uniref:Uncharacterized protein n=1 Tax=Erythroxylum novogranatense TaxID=1862640 RepID=A0AAV8TDY9_9ROSI|nr:hypothetical protein K2173_010482 [Erythroxylum novogranatense]
MSLRIKSVVDKFVEELKEALDADIQDRLMKEREMQSYIEEREREVAEREAAWKAELSRREAEIARQEARLKMEKENLEKEKSVLMGTASNQDAQDGALEITSLHVACMNIKRSHDLTNRKKKKGSSVSNDGMQLARFWTKMQGKVAFFVGHVILLFRSTYYQDSYIHLYA